jgi:hypothetical protein
MRLCTPSRQSSRNWSVNRWRFMSVAWSRFRIVFSW